MTQHKSVDAGLKPCPFCGEAPERIPSGEGGRGLMIECISKGCVCPHTSFYDHASAIFAWNARAPSPVETALYEALLDAKGLADMAVMTDDPYGTESEDQQSLVRLRARIDAALALARGEQA